MPSEKRIKEYMQRHKIGDIFEDLMSKIVTAMPDDPKLFMCRILQRKSDFNLDSRPAITSKSQTKRLTQSVDFSGKSRSSIDDFLSSKDKKIPNKMFHKESAYTGGDDDEELGYYSQEYHGSHHTGQDDELSIGVEHLEEEEADRVSSDPVKMMNRKNQLIQKKLARRKLLEESTRCRQTEAEEDVHTDDKVDIDAVELLESVEDLENEGIKKVKSHGFRTTKRSSKENDVKISVCSRCARCIPIGPESTLVDYGDAFTEEGRIIQTSVSFNDNDDDDDDKFESVSQFSRNFNDSSKFIKHKNPKSDNFFSSQQKKYDSDDESETPGVNKWNYADNDNEGSSYYGAGGISKGTETSRSRTFQGGLH